MHVNTASFTRLLCHQEQPIGLSNYIKQYINLKQVFSSIIVTTNYGGMDQRGVIVMLIIFCFFYRINTTQTNDVSRLTCLPCKQNWRVDWQASHYYLFSWPLLHHRLIKTSMVIPEHNVTDHLLVLFLVIDNVIRIYTKKLFSCNCSQTGFQKKIMNNVF